VEQKRHIVNLEVQRTKIHDNNESEWRLKSRALWIQKGDDNTKYFYYYVKHLKHTNSLWQLEEYDGRHVTGFGNLARAGVNHFSSVLKRMRVHMLHKCFN